MDLLQPKVPPRYVPTLTEIVTGLEPAQVDAVAPLAAAAPELPAALVASAEPALPSAVDVAAAEEQLVQRLLQRVELVLDQRLQACIAQVVQEQTRSITLRLQEELESVVRQTVHDAVAQEMAPGPLPTPR